MSHVADGKPSNKDANDQTFDYMFKLLIIGNSSVGKTSFLIRYYDNSFTSAFVSTVGIDFKVKTVFRNEKKVKLQIWDTAGQERYRTITTAYYRGSMGFILMYDVTNEESFNAVQDWSTQIRTYSWDNAQVVLVGNKCDMEDQRVVSTERGRQLANQMGLEFFETSAKENLNVKEVFDHLVDIICEKMSETLNADPSTLGPPLKMSNWPRYRRSWKTIMVTLTTFFQICMMNLILESNCIIRVSADKEATAPEIINGPVNATVFVDRNHTFICKTKGYPGPDITWQKKVGKTDQWKNVDKSGRLRWAGDKLVINRVLGSDMGFYRCVAFNNFKNTSSGIAYLNVEAVASIVKGPRNHTVAWGTNVTLSCEAVGMPMPARSWYKNGTVMKKQPADPPISVPKFSFNATESTVYECRVQNTHMEGMTNASAVAYVRVIDGKCKSYEGNVCRSHLNGRELIFSKLSDLAYESKMEEHLSSVEREMRKSNVSESCSGRALRVLCKMAFPICRVKGRVAIKQPLCKESCQAVKNLFCGEWWTNPSSKPPLDCQDLPLNRTSENCEFINFFETGNETTHCYTGVGAQYRGNVKVTVSGYNCQAWNSSYPHKHRLNPVLIPDLRANHCRNPGGLRDRPWCFTNGSVEWEYCDVTICENSTTTTVDPNPQEISTYLYAIVSAIFVVLFVVVLAGTCLFVCRLRKCQRSHNITTYRTPDDENLMSELQQLPSVEVVPPQVAKSTVFSKYEFDRNLVVHVEDIALGAFGPVFKARLDSRQGGDQNGPVENCHDPDKQFVAVKMLKDGSHESVQLEFMRQASLIASFEHPNIVKLVGVCFIGSPLCVALEFMGRGDLHSLLPALKPSHFIYSSKYYVRQLLIVRQLVSVLVHLEQLRFLHRDLAARNFLVGSNNFEDDAPLIKLADFGLAVKLEPGGNVHVGVESEAIAVRWTAPESITQGHFTFSSDVWSFGVLLWEVFSYGEKPYKNLHSLEDVSRFILNGGQLESPCPDHPEVFDLMRKCWHVQPKMRCSAKFLSTSLGEIFKNL